MNCEQCTDSPWLNLTSEEPDRQRFIGTFVYAGKPPLGWEYGSIACQRSFTSFVSQEAADDLATAAAQECLILDRKPPHPPGDPDGIQQLFTNDQITATIRCSDGAVVSTGGEGTFSWTFAAGLIVQTNQTLANNLAFAMAVQRARQHKICISPTLAGGCINQPYNQRIVARGGTPSFFPFVGFLVSGCIADEAAGDRTSTQPIPYAFSLVSGSLPPGLQLRSCTGHIKGTPTTGGAYTFTVKAVDAIGSFQQQTFTLTILEISTASPLPDAHIGNIYLENLFTNGGMQELQTWSVIAGALPSGLSLTSSGVLSGTPTGPSLSHTFTAQVVDASLGLTCSKQFTITVGEELFYRIQNFDPSVFDPNLFGCVTTPGTGQPVWDGTFGGMVSTDSFYVSTTISIMTLLGKQILTSNGDGINRTGLRLNGVRNLYVCMQNGNIIWQGQKAGGITGVYTNALFGCSALPATLTIEEIP